MFEASMRLLYFYRAKDKPTHGKINFRFKQSISCLTTVGLPILTLFFEEWSHSRQALYIDQFFRIMYSYVYISVVDRTYMASTVPSFVL